MMQIRTDTICYLFTVTLQGIDPWPATLGVYFIKRLWMTSDMSELV
jgi:hypothetical protein